MAVQASAVIHPAHVDQSVSEAIERIIVATSSQTNVAWTKMGGTKKAEKASSIVLKKDRCFVSSASAKRIACVFHQSEGGPRVSKVHL